MGVALVPREIVYELVVETVSILVPLVVFVLIPRIGVSVFVLCRIKPVVAHAVPLFHCSWLIDRSTFVQIGQWPGSQVIAVHVRKGPPRVWMALSVG
jgi:hypothetical protein